MKYDYGYISGSKGVDEVDVYLGTYLDTAEMVYVVHQRKYGDWDKYDEDKCLLGFIRGRCQSLILLTTMIRVT